MNTTFLMICAAAYLLGSIPFGLILTRMAGLGDVRNIGSGNIGATNVLRTGKKALAALTLILDALKGTVAVLIAAYALPDAMMITAMLALLGHMYPVWLRFKGGKGVASALGIWLGLAPLVFGGMVVAWLLGAFISRISSVGALTAMVVLPVLAWFIAPQFIVAAFLTSLLVIWRHRENIARILKGTEPRIGKKAGAV